MLVLLVVIDNFPLHIEHVVGCATADCCWGLMHIFEEGFPLFTSILHGLHDLPRFKWFSCCMLLLNHNRHECPLGQAESAVYQFSGVDLGNIAALCFGPITRQIMGLRTGC